uniref:Uncharacterized protein n=1 Tax=Lactuca sativa TaxID=4236 RepID=A0A9R1VEZ9_LACSA|nr:hypothetical protein LSAT_V11C500256810 [Lactuca sativa]
MIINPNPKLRLLETKIFPKKYLILPKCKVFELDFGKMKWVSFEETGDEYTFFFNDFKHGVANKLDLEDRRYDDLNKSGNDRFIVGNMWYFPHEFSNINLLHE